MIPFTRLHWGCGRITPAGWINADQEAWPGVSVVCDIRQGLPLDEASIDYAVSMHALPEIPVAEVEDVLWELRRVLKPGAVLRLGLPDMDRAIDAYRRGDASYFLIPDEVAASIGGKMIVQLKWFGRSHSLFTYDYTEEMLRRSGFRDIVRCDFRQTCSRHPEIVSLDNRPKESFFVEATR